MSAEAELRALRSWLRFKAWFLAWQNAGMKWVETAE
jgi:hypothetical protein